MKAKTGNFLMGALSLKILRSTEVEDSQVGKNSENYDHMPAAVFSSNSRIQNNEKSQTCFN